MSGKDSDTFKRAIEKYVEDWSDGDSQVTKEERHAYRTGWNDCRAHYVPKVTEAEAIDLIQKEVFEGNPKRGYAGAVVGVLRAAGVQFKEGA